MKFSKYFMLAGAAALLAACSSEEPVNNGSNENNGEPVGYVKLAIGTTNANTRAEGDTETTVDPETEIKTVEFFFYEGSTLKDTYYAKATDGAAKGWLGATHEESIDQCIVVPITSMKIDKVAVIVNADEQGEDAVLENLSITSGKNGDSFIMSTASLYNAAGNKEVFKTDLEKGSIYMSKTAATAQNATATTIYVERVVAKVQINKDENIEINVPNITEQGSSTDLEVTFTPEKVFLTSTNDNAWMFKRLPATLPEGLSSSEVNGTNRTYWALGHLESGKSTAKISRPTFKNATGTWGDVKYAFDHIGTTLARRTSVVVAGKYEIKKDGTVLNSTNNGTFYVVPDEKKYNVYTTEADVMKALNNGVVPVTGSKLQYNAETGWCALVDADGEEISGMRCMKYDAGRGYYTEGLKRFPTKTTDVAYGVVRNTFYKVNVKKISGIGIGINNEEEPIVPMDPKDPSNVTYYVHMSIEVLPWETVSQDVTW